MKSLDLSKLSPEQLRVLAMIIRSIDDNMPAAAIGSRIRISNLR